jgi:hypothetical protein
MTPLPTLGHYRTMHGIRSVLVYCGNGRDCWHSAKVNVDHLPDETVLRSLGPRMVCTQCGLVGADVRPDWSERVSGLAFARKSQGMN